MREYLIRMVYVEMLGHDASFGHIHAVKLTRARKLVDKRVGYMSCSLCLHKDHELMLLLVGGLQTDLQSQNQLEVATALIVSCKLINGDTIPAVLPLVDKLLSHNEVAVCASFFFCLRVRKSSPFFSIFVYPVGYPKKESRHAGNSVHLLAAKWPTKLSSRTFFFPPEIPRPLPKRNKKTHRPNECSATRTRLSWAPPSISSTTSCVKLPLHCAKENKTNTP